MKSRSHWPLLLLGWVACGALDRPAMASEDVDTDSFEVLSSHPFCRVLRKEAGLT